MMTIRIRWPEVSVGRSKGSRLQNERPDLGLDDDIAVARQSTLVAGEAWNGIGSACYQSAVRKTSDDRNPCRAVG
jgi:hypothetical protein